ncbi:MAG: CoA transferase, partial [Pirellulaceae bacterium]|nr:CoA transferase [Pirellulaceae bacterium]
MATKDPTLSVAVTTTPVRKIDMVKETKHAVRRGPLNGILVLDLTHALSGPYCTMLLAEMGARVIKIERPPHGDSARAFPPMVDGQPEFYNTFNHGKESLAADLESPEDRPLIEAILRKADVLVENFRPGTLERWGLGWEAVQAINPALVYASISGFGQTGPDYWEGAYDVVIQAESGLMNVTGFADGPPVLTGTSLADYLSGTNAFAAINAALVQSKTSGEGSRVDIAMLDSLLGILGMHIFEYLANGTEPHRMGNGNPNIIPFDIFEAQDGPLAICAPDETSFARLAKILGHDDWLEDERFCTLAKRIANRDALLAAIGQAVCEKSRAELTESLQKAGIPAGSVRTVSQAIDSAQS